MEELGDRIRTRWHADQLRDTELLPLMQGRAPPEGFRLAPDGLLEKSVVPLDWVRARFVPVVPAGLAAENLTWKR